MRGDRATWPVLFVTWALGGCTPSIADDPVPGAMQWDSAPPRTPSPTGLLVSTTTGLIDFSLADISVSGDCAAQQVMPEASCELDQYLQTLDGFPTVTPAMAPASQALDQQTLTLGDNVVALTASGAPVTDVDVRFDVGTGYGDGFLTVTPKSTWDLGASYWFAVRGYDQGVRTTTGGEVVGSPTQFLLKQERPLTCGVSDPSLLDRSCPGYDLLLGEGLAPADAASALGRLERARLAYLDAGVWDLVAAAGIPKSEVAVLWGFPVHTNSVAELSPTIVPQVIAPNQIRVDVHGPVDPATVSPFVAKQRKGSVVLMDLTDVPKPDLVNGLPQIDAQLSGGSILITGAAPFPTGDIIGLFFTDDLHDDQGNPLVASPLSVLLTLQGSLADESGHSTISGVSDSDARTLEAGRQQLAPVFDSSTLVGLTGVARNRLVYCFAFTFEPPQ